MRLIQKQQLFLVGAMLMIALICGILVYFLSLGRHAFDYGYGLVHVVYCALGVFLLPFIALGCSDWLVVLGASFLYLAFIFYLSKVIVRKRWVCVFYVFVLLLNSFASGLVLHLSVR